MRIATYNVNSLNPRLPRVLALLEAHDIDVLLLQETKCAPEQFPHRELAEAGYLAADHSGGRWEGVAIVARATLGITEVDKGLAGEPSPAQARWIEATVGDLRMVSVYVPNGQRVDSEFYKEKLIFFERMAARGAEMRAQGRVLIGGDMNVCATDRDAYDPDALHGGTHATEAERQRWSAVAEAGFVDLYRHLEPEEPGFTWWDYRAGHFHKGFGLRIDYLLGSDDGVADTVATCGIDRDFRKPTRVPESKPSDHAPLMAGLDLTVRPNDAATDDPMAALPEEPEQLGLL